MGHLDLLTRIKAMHCRLDLIIGRQHGPPTVLGPATIDPFTSDRISASNDRARSPSKLG